MKFSIIGKDERGTVIEETTTSKRRFNLEDLDREIEMLENEQMHLQERFDALIAKRSEILEVLNEKNAGTN